jgi:hypothetical protein
MEYKYFTLPLVDKTVYFRIEIKKYHKYSAHDIDYQDYFVIINDIDIWDKDVNFEDKYGGLFLVITKNKELKIFDNITKKIIEIENNNDIREIFYFYIDNEYSGVSLDYVVKEIIYENIVNYY